MITYRAAWVCPIVSPPLRDGWVSISEGRVIGLGDASAVPRSAPRDLGRRLIMPGLVNAHTHLELSGLRDRVPPAHDFVDWVKQLVLTRRGRHEDPSDPAVHRAALEAAREARSFGTAAVGDISNSLATVNALGEAGLSGVVFHELLGFDDA
jgi:5-methylthioadenosine/S-adenosylhomocysteine deaminase